MPLPATSERAARAVARVLADLDDRVARFLAGSGSLPTAREVRADLVPLVTAAVSAALRDIDPDVPLSVITAAVNAQLDDLQAAIQGTLDDARAVRRRMPRTPPEQDDGEPVAAFIRRVGKFAALAALLSASRPRAGRTPDVSKVARQVSVRVPRRTAGYGRMLVRTNTAIARNRHSADVVEQRFAAKRAETGKKSRGAVPGDWVVLVLDARKGPTDRECEEVNGKYATPGWIRKHPVEHPNCTRAGRPKVLPAGESVTLLG